MNNETKFGGKLSVRLDKETRPLLMFGHDESIFNQFFTYQKMMDWTKWRNAARSQGDGQGVMLSAFQSREFGFGSDLSKEELDEVNFTRRGKEYKDKDAAKKIRGNAEKHPLMILPFIVEFEFGITK